MGKAIAIALKQEHAFIATVKYALRYVADFMYGTPERVKFTYAFALGLAILGSLLNIADSNAFSVCSHDTLPKI